MRNLRAMTQDARFSVVRSKLVDFVQITMGTILGAAGLAVLFQRILKWQVPATTTQKGHPVKLVETESTFSGLVTPEKNEILDQHYREHPEGDPAVRRISPDRGVLPREKNSANKAA